MIMEFPVYLPGGLKGVLSVPAPLSRRDYELVETQVTAALEIIHATAVAEPEPAPSDYEDLAGEQEPDHIEEDLTGECPVCDGPYGKCACDPR
jgi:hypothetical protein